MIATLSKLSSRWLPGLAVGQEYLARQKIVFGRHIPDLGGQQQRAFRRRILYEYKNIVIFPQGNQGRLALVFSLELPSALYYFEFTG